MKKNTLIAGLILSCILILSHAQTCCETKDYIRITGLGENRVKPDIAILYASLISQSQTASEALSKLDANLILITLGLEDNVTQVMTSSIRVYPTYKYINFTKTQSGYAVYLSLTITVRGIQSDNRRIAKTIDTLSSSGVKTISGITYDTADPEAGKTVARTNAFDDAASKARLYAQLASRDLGKITLIEQMSISYSPYFYSSQGDYLSYSSTQYVPESQSSQQGYGSAAPAAGYDDRNQIPNIPIGTILVSATVFVSWELM